MCSNFPGIKLEPALQKQADKIKHLSSHAYVVHTTAKPVFSRRRKNENVCKMSKNEKCTCKACKTIVFHCQICKFVTLLLQSSLWLLRITWFSYRRVCRTKKIHRTAINLWKPPVKMLSTKETIDTTFCTR